MPLPSPDHDDVIVAATTLPGAARDVVSAAAAVLAPMRVMSQADTATAADALAAITAWRIGQAALTGEVMRLVALAVRGGASVSDAAVALGVRRESLSRRLQDIPEAKRRQGQK